MKRRNKSKGKGGDRRASSHSKLSLFQKPGIKFFRPCPLSGNGAPVIDYKNIKVLKGIIQQTY